MRNATAVDIVRSLTDNPNLTVRDMATSSHLDGILNAVRDAVSAGFITGHPAFPYLAEGITYCQTCIDGCNHRGGQGSCEHRGCWGPDATNNCTGITVARYVDQHHPHLYATD